MPISLFPRSDRINLAFNRLTGTIPSELGKLSSLRGLFLENNKLSGTVPAELSGLTRITTVNIGANDFTGSLPFQLCEVFNETLPGFSGDCSEFEDGGPCMTTCCVDDDDCRCRYFGTPQEFLCFQQKL
jgi:Leucine rich repeat